MGGEIFTGNVNVTPGSQEQCRRLQ